MWNVNNTTEIRCSFPVGYQVTINLSIRTSTVASDIGLRKQPQNFHLFVDFQGQQAEVSFREANSPAPQSRDDTSSVTAKAPTYDATQFNRNSCQPPTRQAKKANHTATHNHRSHPYRKRQKQAASRPQDMGGKILSRDEQELHIAPERSLNNGKAVQMSFYGGKDLKNLIKGLPRNRHGD